jgi:2-aminoadipate transaminase
MINIDPFFSGDASVMQYSAIRQMAKMASQQGMISFAAGAPNADTFPVQEIGDIASSLLATDGKTALQYGLTLGFGGLVEAVLEFSAQKGIPAMGPEQVAISSGSQQGLDLIGRLLIDPGDVVFVELPSYIGAISAFRNLQARLIGVRQGDDGIEIDDLIKAIESVRRSGMRPKMIYVIPNFQNPSGVTLSMTKRQQLLDVAEKHDLLILEDDPYGEVYFNKALAEKRQPIKSFDQQGRVIYLSTFSKILAPGLRTGWLLAAPEIIAKLDMAKQSTDLCGSMLDQRIVAECWKRGVIQKHLPEIRRFYHSRCQVMLECLKKLMPSGVRWTEPEGGLFLWVTLPQNQSSEQLLDICLREASVSFVIGQPFHVNGEGTNCLRLAFSKESEDNIRVGIERLAKIFKSHLE